MCPNYTHHLALCHADVIVLYSVSHRFVVVFAKICVYPTKLALLLENDDLLLAWEKIFFFQKKISLLQKKIFVVKERKIFLLEEEENLLPPDDEDFLPGEETLPLLEEDDLRHLKMRSSSSRWSPDVFKPL